MKIAQYLSDEEVTRVIMREYQKKYISVTFTAGALTQTVYHKLKRVPEKWIVAKNNADTRVWGTDDREKITLTASGPCVITLEVA